MVTVNQLFRRLTFKGIELDVASVQVGFSQELAKHKYIFRDQERVQNLGSTNETFRYSVVFSENRRTGSYTDTFFLFLNACKESTPGELITPDRGTIQAACVSMNYSLDTNMKDGTMVDVEFVEAPADDDDITQAATLAAVQSTAEVVRQQVQAVPDLPDFDADTLVDPLTALTGLTDQIVVNIDRQKGIIDGQIYKVQNLENSVNALGDRLNWTVSAAARQHESALFEARKRLGGLNGKSLKFYTVPQTMPLISVAAAVNTDLNTLLKLNPELTNSSTVLALTLVKYY